MSAEPRRYEVVSFSLPSDLVRRANALIPKTRRSRVIARVLTSFLEAIERGKVAEEYRAYYAQRGGREAKEERDLLAEWQVSDDEAWAVLEAEEKRGRRPPR
jgi:metal-responsive CopG/Arc/MetJ family transcriptional regulator